MMYSEKANSVIKTEGEKEDRGPNGDVGIEGNSGSDGKGEWSEMVRYVLRREGGHVLRVGV